MNYLQTSLTLLQQENQQLQEKLAKMEQLNNIINQQRTEQQKDYLNRLHHEEINVIRDMADQQQQSLKNEIRNLKAQVRELTQGLMQEDEKSMVLKRQIQGVSGQLQDARVENVQLRQQVQGQQQKIASLEKEHEARVEQLERQFNGRERQIIQKYMQKIDQLTERYDDELVKKQRVITSQRKKIDLAQEQKLLLEDQLQKMTTRWQQEESRRVSKSKYHQQELQTQKAQNYKLSLEVKRLSGEIGQLKEALRQEARQRKSVQVQLSGMKKKYGELELIKKKQVERQKSKTLSICKNLADHKKYWKGQLDVSKRKQNEFNRSKKQLINKIKEMEDVSDKCRSTNTSFVEKTIAKNQKKQTFETYQSASLDNSFSRDSPAVSCFLKDSKIESKLKLKKKPLTIDTNNHQTLLRFESLDTPCFQSAKEANKKTIKIRK